LLGISRKKILLLNISEVIVEFLFHPILFANNNKNILFVLRIAAAETKVNANKKMFIGLNRVPFFIGLDLSGQFRMGGTRCGNTVRRKCR